MHAMLKRTLGALNPLIQPLCTLDTRKWVSPGACEWVQQQLWLHILKLFLPNQEPEQMLQRESDNTQSELPHSITW